jgi:hypothetical protein
VPLWILESAVGQPHVDRRLDSGIWNPYPLPLSLSGTKASQPSAGPAYKWLDNYFPFGFSCVLPCSGAGFAACPLAFSSFVGFSEVSDAFGGDITGGRNPLGKSL